MPRNNRFICDDCTNDLIGPPIIPPPMPLRLWEHDMPHFAVGRRRVDLRCYENLDEEYDERQFLRRRGFRRNGGVGKRRRLRREGPRYDNMIGYLRNRNNRYLRNSRKRRARQKRLLEVVEMDLDFEDNQDYIWDGGAIILN